MCIFGSVAEFVTRHMYSEWTVRLFLFLRCLYEYSLYQQKQADPGVVAYVNLLADGATSAVGGY